MKFIFRMEKILISVTCVVCILLILKLLYSLRTIFPWRVNCWFCNSNFWVKFCERNCFICRKCEQYNGFTKDGDYNKPITSNGNENGLKTPKVFQSSPPKNGLCKMCNINQQLKVAQLANFVPMNERNFDEEIESYRMQLEKAYKLCSPCKKVLQTKLHKEKEVLLGTKLLEARTPDKKAQKMEMLNTKLLNFINSAYFLTTTLLMILTSVECYTSVTKNTHLLSKISNIKDILTEFLERIVLILKMKMLLTFPELDKYLIDVPQLINVENWFKDVHLKTELIEKYSIFVHEAIGSIAIMILFVEYYFNKSKSKSRILTEAIWSMFMVTCFCQHFGTMDLIISSLLKLLFVVTILFLNRNTKNRSIKQTRKISTSPKNIKNLTNPMNSTMEEDDSMETDDDVSLSQFGLHNLSDSSNETAKVVNTSLINGRAFTPRNENNSIWKKPKLNSTFCANSVLKSPSSVSEIVFAKPNYQKVKHEESFHKYQNLTKHDSDSDLDESINSLCIGSPKKSKKNGSIFTLRKFTATPNFVAPTPMTRARPLISPSKLGHSTSWVAGGYWGSEGDRQIFSVNGSRSSSQSSGFESQASSSQRDRNLMSQPPSREDSICGEPDRASVFSDQFQNCNMNHYAQGPHHFSQHGPQKFPSHNPSNFIRHTPSNMSRQTPSNFSRVSSPVYPQMQYNSHVHIPQPRFAQQGVANVFAQQQFGQPDLFKSPGGAGVIKLPQMNSFSSR